jgi:hypothetical protein
MPEEKKGKKPENLGDGGKGDQEPEVGGRGLVLYTCWADGAGNWIPDYWTYFICWRDHVLNYV